MLAVKGVNMAEIWMHNYCGLREEGFDTWDSLAYCFHGRPLSDEWADLAW